jgi:predicted ester cyclase
VLDAFLSRFPDRRIAVIATIADGERVAVQYDYVATSPGGIPGLPPPGERFTSQGCWVAEVRDGQIRSARDYIDRPR